MERKYTVKKTIMMLNAVCALFVVPPSFAATSQYPCDYPLIHAYTGTGEKEVKVCLREDFAVYTFGKVNVNKPEIDIVVPKKDVELFSYDHGEEATITQGDYMYTVSNLTDESSHSIKELIIHKDHEKVASIKLGKFEYSRITYGNAGDFNFDVEAITDNNL